MTLADVLAQTLSATRAAFAPGGVSCWDYAIPAEFEALWSALEDSCGPPPGHAIVCWSDTPSDPTTHPIPSSRHVTPLDWAAAAAHRQPQLQITIVDLLPADHRELPTYREWELFDHAMVSWLAVVTESDLCGVSDADDLRRRLQPRGGAAAKVTPQHLLDAVLRQLASPHTGSHHAIANLIGPLLLFGDAAPGYLATSPHRRALHQLLAATQGPSVEDRAPHAPELPLFNLRTAVPKGTIELVLIDDQHRHGWGQFLCAAVGVPYGAQEQADDHVVLGSSADGRLHVSAMRSPRHLLDTLAARAGAQSRFSLSLGICEADHEIVFLDLRLFAGQSEALERNYVAEMRQIARAVSASAGLPWPAIADPELAEMPYLDALSLLPRVLALTDLSLPIVLFSSTGQRRIVENLAAYENIITTFEKPRHFGYVDSDPGAEGRVKLAAALAQACQLLRARDLCRSLVARARASPPNQRGRWTAKRHFELYVDESGSSMLPGDLEAADPERQRFVVGGLLLGYRDADPWPLHHAMANAGLRWWPERFADPYVLKSVRSPAHNLPGGVLRAPEDVIAEMIREARATGVTETGVAIAIPAPAVPRTAVAGDVDAVWRIDNRYRLLLSILIETVLFDLLPAFVADPDATLSIFVATRARTAREFVSGSNAVRRLRELYGFEGDDRHLRSVSECSILPIVHEALARRPASRSPVRIEHARGAKLCYPALELDANGCPARDATGDPIVHDREPKWPNTTHQHYLADLVVGRCRAEAGCPQGMPELFRTGTYDTLDARFDALLTAARAIEGGDRAGAIAALAGIRWGDAVAKRSIAAVLLERLARVAEHELTGREFRALARQLDDDTVGAASSSAALTGRVAHVDLHRGYGLVATTGHGRVHFWMRAWRSATLPERGDSVELAVVMQPDGRTTAIWVRAIV